MKTATEKRNERIWATICDIPEGSVASYGQIAEIAGIPRGARQVAGFSSGQTGSGIVGGTDLALGHVSPPQRPSHGERPRRNL